MTDHDDLRMPRSPRVTRAVLPGTCADRFPGLANARTRLDGLRVRHLAVSELVLTESNGEIRFTDMFVTAALQRSYGLVDACIDTVDMYNLHAAAPLVRLQLDSLFRLSYVAHAPDTDEVAKEILAGRRFKDMRDSEGEKLSDFRLKKLALQFHPWAGDVYDQASGWVHFSRDHISATWQSQGDHLSMSIPLAASVVPERLWRELVDAMTLATSEVLGYAEQWASRKGLAPNQFRDLSKDGHPVVTVGAAMKQEHD